MAAVNSVMRALDILEAVEGSVGGLTLSEIASSCGLSPSTTHRLIQSLLERDYLSADLASRRYSIGPTVMRLSHQLVAGEDTSRITLLAVPLLSEFRDLTGETASLHIRLGHSRVCIAEVPSDHSIRVVSSLGSVRPIHAGAASKALMAWAPSDLMEEVLAHDLAPLTARTVVEADHFRRELAMTRARGYAVSQGESVPGAAAIALPILSASGHAIAAINVTGPEFRFTPDVILEFGGVLAKRVAAVSAALGYVPAVESMTGVSIAR